MVSAPPPAVEHDPVEVRVEGEHRPGDRLVLLGRCRPGDDERNPVFHEQPQQRSQPGVEDAFSEQVDQMGMTHLRILRHARGCVLTAKVTEQSARTKSLSNNKPPGRGCHSSVILSS